MELEKYEPQATVSKLADRPKDSAAELKAKFDEAEKNIGEYINEKLIPKLEEMEEYSNIAFRYAGTIASGDEMPVLTTSDAGKVYNILDDRTYEYTCVWEGAVTKTDNYAYIHVSGIYDNIHNVYRMRYDQFVTSKTDKTKTNKVFYDGRDESGDARFQYDYNYEPKILFENKEEVIVTIDTNIKLLRGENIVWTGHFWNKLSCDTDYKVEKDSCYPVQSGAVYNAIKEHSDNKENPHGVTAEQVLMKEGESVESWINGTLIPELEEMKKYSNEAFRHAGMVGVSNIPSLTVEDKGRVYNIRSSGTLKYTITYDGVVSENSFSNHLYLTGSYDGIADEYLRSMKKIQIVSEDCSSYAHLGSTDGQETVFYLEAENGHYKEFKAGSEVTVSIEAELPLKCGDNIVWDGYYWDKLSCDAVDYVSENASAPVQSGAVYNAIKEHADNTENFHGLPLTKGSGENSLQQKGCTASEKDSVSLGYTTFAKGKYSCSRGYYTCANGKGANADGQNTYANGEYQNVSGKYNVLDNDNKYASIVGNGTSDDDRSNAYTLDWEGNAEFAGDVKSKGNTLESTANKVTAIDENSTDEQYPSAKSVWTFGNGLGSTLMNYVNTYFAQKLYVDETEERLQQQIGDIETALDNIIAIQNELMGVSE